MEPDRVAERVVPPYRDERIDVQRGENAEDVGGEIQPAVHLRVLGVPQEGGNLCGFDLAGVRPGCVEERPPRTVDRACVRLRQGDHPLRRILFVRGVVVQEPPPAAADAEDFVSRVDGAENHRLDARVEAGDVSAACEYADAFHSVMPSFVFLVPRT